MPGEYARLPTLRARSWGDHVEDGPGLAGECGDRSKLAALVRVADATEPYEPWAETRYRAARPLPHRKTRPGNGYDVPGYATRPLTETEVCAGSQRRIWSARTGLTAPLL